MSYPEEIVLANRVDGSTRPPEILEPEQVVSVPATKPFLQRCVCLVFGCCSWLFGLITLVAALAVLATIPIFQFLSLGYFLEASARIARSGRLRNGFIGIHRMARLGSIFIGTWICVLPLRFVSSMAYSSHLINGDTPETRMWRIGFAFAVVVSLVHIVWAWFRGGRFRHFLWPAPFLLMRRLRQGNLLLDARDATCDFAVSLRLDHYFSLGVRGFSGAIVWLFVPVTLMVLGNTLPPGVGVITGLLGSLLLGVVVIHLPFLQTRFAITNRFSDLFCWQDVHKDFARAPIAFWFALFLTLAFALPLYLLKAELIPRQAAWLPSLFFVVFMYPSRIATGWALSRALRRETPRHILFRLSSLIAFPPMVAFYVGFVFLTQYVSWYGRWSLYEQHAFLLPVPFLGM